MLRLSRRSFLASAPALGFRPQPATERLKIVVTGGHPGDPEYGCGGTVARYVAAGHEVVLLYLNRGEYGCPAKSPEACGELRTAEARKACELLGARAVFAGQIDGHAVVDNRNYEEFRKLLENEKPAVLFTHWPIDNHPDHRAMSTLAYNAWLGVRKQCAFYYYEVSDGEDTLMFRPTDYVDISGTEPRKRAACYAHASQSPDKFYELQAQVARFRGFESGYILAEAFVRHVQSVKAFLP